MSSNKGTTFYAINLELGHHPTFVRPQFRPQSLGHRHGSVSDHTNRRPSQKTHPCHRCRGQALIVLNHDSRSVFHLDLVFFHRPGSQPPTEFVHRKNKKKKNRFLRFSLTTGRINLLLLSGAYSIDLLQLKSSVPLCWALPRTPL